MKGDKVSKGVIVEDECRGGAYSSISTVNVVLLVELLQIVFIVALQPLLLGTCCYGYSFLSLHQNIATVLETELK